MQREGDEGPDSPTATRARILIVEESKMVREGLLRLFANRPDLECCGESDCIAGTDLLVAQLAPDLVLMGLRLRDGKAFQLIEALKGQFPSVPVLILSISDSAVDVTQAIRAGARGYVLKQDPVEILLDAIRHVLEGRFYVSRSLTLCLIENNVREHERPTPHPSPRPRR